MRTMKTLLVAAAAIVAAVCRADPPRPLFDGTSLAGWETVDGDARWWKAADGMLVGGSLVEHQDRGVLACHIAIDPDGKVGKAYDAKTTPHMIVIGKDGKVAYNGAIDSINSTDAADIEKADKHVVAALDALLSGKTVELAKTKPYGCGVKYAK